MHQIRTIRTSENSPLRIYTIALPGNRGQIGMTICPCKKDRGFSGTSWDRDLETDLDVISVWGAHAVVKLMEEFELDMLRVTPSMLGVQAFSHNHFYTEETRLALSACKLRARSDYFYATGGRT